MVKVAKFEMWFQIAAMIEDWRRKATGSWASISKEHFCGCLLTQRPHSSLSYLPPVVFAERAA
jgi:hypothetical protein